jgi:hypothetical protein
MLIATLGRYSGDAPWSALEFRTMGESKKPNKKNRTWAESLIRKRPEFLGTVEARDNESAEAAAAAEFNLNGERRKRLVIQEQA